MNIRKSIMVAAAACMLSASAVNAADELKILPIFTDDNYCGQFEVSAVLQSIDFEGIDSRETAYGVEVGFDCPVFTLPGDHILRQQLTVTSYDTDGLGTSIEMNPYYFFKLQENLLLGVGPGIGAIEVADTWEFTYQAGAGLKYYLDNNLLIGADFRWQTIDATSSSTNTRLMAKVGYRF